MRRAEKVKITNTPLKAAIFAGSFFVAPAAFAQTEITLPLFGTVDAVVDWGAEGANAFCTRAVTTAGNVTCNYPTSDGPGPFTVRVSGTVSQFGAGESGPPNPHADRILRVNRFGNVGLTSLSAAFDGAKNLTEVAEDFPEAVTDISNMFRDTPMLNDNSIRNWGMRTRNVVNMEGAFENSVQLSVSLDIWCVRSVPTPPARFRDVEEFRISALETRLRARGLGESFTLPRVSNLTPEREPKWGNCGVSFDASNIAAAQSGEAYSLDLRARASLWESAPAEANVNNLTFAVVSGSLPEGLELNSATGEITGTPTEAGTYTFTIEAEQP